MLWDSSGKGLRLLTILSETICATVEEEVLDEVVLDEEEVVSVETLLVVVCLAASLKTELKRAQAPIQSTSKTLREISIHLSLPFFLLGGCDGGCP